MSKEPISWPAGTSDPMSLDLGEPSAKHLGQDLLDRWARGLEDWNAPGPVGTALENLSRRETAVVVTGQQPGFWGGPLFSLWKAATAIALAERLARDRGKPAVAVFWVQGEDTDWDEVGWGALPGEDLSLIRHRWTSSPVGSRSWVGSAVVESPAGMRGPFESRGLDPSAFDLSRAGGADLSTHFVRAMLSLFGAHGLLPLDGRWPETRRGGGELWSRYHSRHEEIAEAVGTRGKEIVPPGAPPPLDAETADHGLFVLSGETRLEIDPGSWESRVGELLKTESFDALAPSVLLRAPLQDHLFGTAFHVTGTVEGSYLRQLKPVYASLGIPAPARIPRLHATALPRGLVPRDRARNILEDPEAWIAEEAETRVSSRARAALDGLRKEVSGRLEQLAGEASGGGKDLEQLAASAQRKILAQLGRLDEALVRREKQRLYREAPRLRHLPEFLRPRRGPQERGISAAAAEFFFGETTAEVILQAARDHLDRLNTGELHHFVLEDPRE